MASVSAHAGFEAKDVIGGMVQYILGGHAQDGVVLQVTFSTKRQSAQGCLYFDSIWSMSCATKKGALLVENSFILSLTKLNTRRIKNLNF